MSNIKLDKYFGSYTNVVIPPYAINDSRVLSKITQLGSSCFQDTSVKVVYGDTLEKINKFTFYNCSTLKKVSFPKCKYIDDFAFCRCQEISEVNFPFVSYIGELAFQDCTKLETISFPECNFICGYAFANTKWINDQFSKSKIVELKTNYQNFLISASYNFSEQLSRSDITFICAEAFQSCSNVTSLNFNNCTYAGECAFQDCINLSQINLVKCSGFGNGAFYNCNNLLFATFPYCKRITNNMFTNCSSLSIVSINCNYIDDQAFLNCTSLSTFSFPNCSYIGGSAFYNTNWMDTQLEKSSIITYSTNIENFLLYVEPNYSDKLENTSATFLCKFALNNCNNLVNASFINCHYIGEQAFNNCSSLKQVRFMSTSIATLKDVNAFSHCTQLLSIGVPANLINDYKVAPNWSQYSSKIVDGSIVYVGEKPTNPSVKIYNGSMQTNGYTCPTGVHLEGKSQGTNAGTYIAKYTPQFGYAWNDGSQDTVTVTLVINNASVGNKPTNPSPITYDGNNHTNGYTCPANVTMTGQDNGTNANTYIAKYTPNINYAWSDNTRNTVTITFIINKASVGKKPINPSETTYTGLVQTNGYTCPIGVILEGDDRGTNANIYIAKYTPKSNYIWSDNTQDTVTITLIINKATGYISLNTGSASVNVESTVSISVTSSHGGAISASSNNGNVSVSVSGSTVNIYGISAGTSVITVTSATTENYTAASAICNMTIIQPVTTFYIDYKQWTTRGTYYGWQTYQYNGVPCTWGELFEKYGTIRGVENPSCYYIYKETGFNPRPRTTVSGAGNIDWSYGAIGYSPKDYIEITGFQSLTSVIENGHVYHARVDLNTDE